MHFLGRVFFSFFLGISLAEASSVEPVKINLEKELEKISAKNLYDLDPKIKESSLSSVSKMKYFEIKKRWKECGALGRKVVASHAEIQGWVAASWLKCEIKNFETEKNKSSLNKPLQWLRHHQDLMTDGLWGKSLWQDYIAANMTLLEMERNPKMVNELLEESERIPNEALSTLYAYAGEFAEKKEAAKALYFYEQSLQLKESKSVRERFEVMKNKLNLKFNTNAPPLEGLLENEGAEVALEEKMNRSLKANDLMTALKTAVLIQTEYVGSKGAKRLKDKPFDIYQQLTKGTPSDEKNEKAFLELEKISSLRRSEWAQNLHRRAEYAQALIFAESALKDEYRSSQATVLYWIAGRAAHLVGQYDRALLHFSKLIEFHAGTDEAAEAMLRSGLIHLRLRNVTSAVAHFDNLISQKKEKFDLQARYWLIRALENISTEKERATVESKILIERYPFSYYGLRLTAETNKGQYSWPRPNPSIPSHSQDLWLTGDQKKIWNRFKSLTKAGWLMEAQAEAQDLPRTKNPWLSFQLAKFMAKCFQFPVAIRAMSEAMDLENSLRSSEILSYVYPKVFSPWIEGEAKKYNLNPILVRSLIRQESAFGLRAQSSANAQGLMQLIPSTAQDVARRLGMKKIEFPEDVFRPEINIPLGTFYISSMIDQFAGNVPFALGAYNAGPTKMRAFTEARTDVKELVTKGTSSPMDEIWFDELPWSETSFYIKAILRNTLLYKLLDSGKVEWDLVLWQDLHNKKANLK